MRFSTFALTFGALLCLAPLGLSNTCDTIPGNIVANCGFDDGTYTGMIPLPGNNSDPGVPDSWSYNDGFIEGYVLYGINTVIADPITGTDYLSFGTGPFGPDASLSQFLSDVAGVTYDGNIVGSYLGGGGDFFVLIDGDQVGGTGSFSFVGSGFDELTLYAAEGVSYDISDLVITPAGESAVPEPRATFLIPVAMLACLVWLSTRRRPTLQ